MAISCKDCQKVLPNLIHIEGRCYPCHAAAERKPLQEEIERLRQQVECLTSRNAANRFWIVLWEGDTQLYRHIAKESAEVEAERLTRCNPGHVFFVLEVTSGFRIGVRPDKLSIRDVSKEEVVKELSEVEHD